MGFTHPVAIHTTTSVGHPSQYSSWYQSRQVSNSIYSWWPDCNWCSAGGRNHLAHSGPSSNDSDEASSPQRDRNEDGEDDPPDDDYYTDGLGSDTSASREKRSNHVFPPAPLRHRLIRVRRSASNLPSTSTSSTSLSTSLGALLLALDDTLPLPQAPLGDPLPFTVSGTPTTSRSAAERTAGTAQPAQNAVRTKRPSCTPSPTSSMAPSATWTTCPYVNRDGQVNPDVRRVKDPGTMNNAGQSTLYNAMAYAFTQDPVYSKTVAAFVYTLLLDPKSRMNPHANYGQIVRGPGPAGSTGSFTGILDMRGMVKIYNAVGIVKAFNSPHWTNEMDRAFKNWVRAWVTWMSTSDLGKKAGTRPNNHCTFYAYQVAGARLAMGDIQGARQTIRGFLGSCFQEQISASGEQPYEAVRTRPYHYRCFNLEGLFVSIILLLLMATKPYHEPLQALAKLSDEAGGEDMWSAKSKHGGTLKKALDYTMSMDPKREDVGQILPLVAAGRIAFGDPDGKYASFLERHSRNYRSKPYWYYNQPNAFPNARTSRGKRQVTWGRDDTDLPVVRVKKDSIPFTCPAIFEVETCVELDLGFCVTCEVLRPFFI
ncbi:hypothetical protein AAF712_001040 [Marasmius tenuissimus]|uniref:Alginate lyase domain-containing protein n=1 Tax=Marasmius tenuissimus TaxID=585030 RepID=A0ABR3AHQ6_9AGAR